MACSTGSPGWKSACPTPAARCPICVGRLTPRPADAAGNEGRGPAAVQTYLKRFTYDTISHSPTLLRFSIELVGADRVMLGSDYCFDMGYIRPREIVEKRLRLSRADQRRIVGATAARLLALG